MGASLHDDHEHHSHPQRWVAAGAIITLLESAGQLATIAVGLSVYNCALNTSSNTVWQMVHLYYFSHESCAPYIVDEQEYFFDGVNSAALRTAVFMSFYTVLYSIWFIGSILLLVSATKGKQMDAKLGRNLQYVWTIPFTLIIFLDLVATITYCLDLLSTDDFSSVMGLLNLKTDGSVHELNEVYLSEPPKVMALLASKAGIVWIINVIILIILLAQFKKLFLLRKQQEFVRAQLATMPAYLWPPKLIEKNLPTSKDAPVPIEQAPTIPRLINNDGVVVRAPQSSGTMAGRSSALQMAARQGFSYERPNGGGWSPTNPGPSGLGPAGPGPSGPSQRMSAPQKYGYSGFPQENFENNWYSRNASLPARENDKSNNILQRDNDVFY